jgi:D-alanyl-D-alanine carboxypeptidase
MNRRRFLFSVLILIALAVGSLLYVQRRHTPDAKATNAQKSITAQTSATPNPTTGGFDRTARSTIDPASIWVVVNKQHPLNPRNYAPADLSAVGSGQYLRSEAAAAFQQMVAGAKRDGLVLTAASGYRSYDTQVSVYNKEVADFGQARADSESARPGYSEHQTGLGVDIAGGGCSIEDCFAGTAEGRWAATNSYKYGYILRYTTANSTVTGYRAEAWHFRYVGPELATELHNLGDHGTLEEFFGVSGGASY